MLKIWIDYLIDRQTDRRQEIYVAINEHNNMSVLLYNVQ